MPLFLPYFLSLFYHFLSFSPFFFIFGFLILSCHGLFPLFGLSFSWVPLSGCLLLSYHGFSLFKCFPPLGLPLLVFFSLPLFFSSSLVFSSSIRSSVLPWLPSFYSKLIQWNFSLLPLGLHQLFLVCCGHPFKITHSPIGCPCHCSVHVCCNATHFTTKFPFVCSYCIALPLGD